MSLIIRSIEQFRPHHVELRQRLIRVFIALVVCSAIAYIFSENIARFFMVPLFDASPHLDRLVYTNLPEAFLSYLKLSLLIGVLASFPFMLFQLWMFISPGLRSNEKKIRCYCCVLGNSSFCYGCILCALWRIASNVDFFYELRQ